MKGTTLLQRQHRRVMQLLDAVEDEHYVRGALLLDLADDLAATMMIEEAIFYPALRDMLGVPLGEADVDHANAARGLHRMFEAHHEGDAARFRSEVGALRALVSEHFEREETSLYPGVERAFSSEQLERLGDQMKKLHRAILEADGEESSSSIGRPSRADWYRFDLDVAG